MTLSGTVQQPETGRGHDETTHYYLRPPRISFHTHSKLALTTTLQGLLERPRLVASVCRIPSFITTRKTPVATSQVEEEARYNQTDKLLIKKAVTINTPLQRIVLPKFIHLRKFPAIYSPF